MDIFLSYCWHESNIANCIESNFKRFGIYLTRDFRDMKYNQNIHAFMERITLSDRIILLISDDFLKSVNCMYEASQILPITDKEDRVFPIIVNDTHIFTMKDKRHYIDYWNNYLKKSNSLNRKYNSNFTEELKDIKIANDSISDFIDFIKDSKRFNYSELSYDSLFEVIGVKKQFPTVLSKSCLDWIAEEDCRKVDPVLNLIYDLYESERVIFSGYPNIPDGESDYFFHGISIENDFFGISIKLSMVQAGTNLIKNINYSNVSNIEENDMRSPSHSKYYFYVTNPDKKQQYDFAVERAKYGMTLSDDEKELLSIGYIDVYRIIIRFSNSPTRY